MRAGPFGSPFGGNEGVRNIVTDRIALVLGIVLVGAVALDLAANGGAALLFLARKLIDLVDYLAIWR